VGERIVNVHLCDATTMENGAVRYDMPGFGKYDFGKMFHTLSEYGYKGPAFIEVYSDMYEEIPTLYESRARMQRIVKDSPLR